MRRNSLELSDPVITKQKLRDKFENDFLAFCAMVFKKRSGGREFFVEPHHRVTTEVLSNCWNGKCPRLIISMPPGFGKTTMAIYYIAWSFLKNPFANYMYISYSEGLCISSSREIRAILSLPAVEYIWGKRIVPAESAKSWYVYDTINNSFTQLGRFRVAPCDGQITGFDAGVPGKDASHGGIVIDDFMKAIDSKLETKRKKAYETYENTIRTRLRDTKAAIIIIMQRLHPLDVVGCILDKQKNISKTSEEYFKVIKIQAWSKKLRQPTCPRLISRERIYDLMKREPILFESQYQQSPENITNSFFTVSKIKREFQHKLEENVFLGSIASKMEYIVRGWDFNYSASDRSDWSVGVQVGYKDNVFYILDICRFRAVNGDSTHDLKTVFYRIARKDNSMNINSNVFQSVPEDPGYSVATELVRTMYNEGISVHKSKDKETKTVRWFEMANAINSGDFVYVERKQSKTKMEDDHVRREFFNELSLGEGGEFNDQIDALERAFTHIQSLSKRKGGTQMPSIHHNIAIVYK